MTKLVNDDDIVVWSAGGRGNAATVKAMREMYRAQGVADDVIEHWLFEHVAPRGEG